MNPPIPHTDFEAAFRALPDTARDLLIDAATVWTGYGRAMQQSGWVRVPEPDGADEADAVIAAISALHASKIDYEAPPFFGSCAWLHGHYLDDEAHMVGLGIQLQVLDWLARTQIAESRAHASTAPGDQGRVSPERTG